MHFLLKHILKTQKVASQQQNTNTVHKQQGETNMKVQCDQLDQVLVKKKKLSKLLEEMKSFEN